MLKRIRVYRMFRISLAVASILPRYWLLLARAALGQAVAQADWDRVHEHAAQTIRRLAIALEGGLIKAAQIAGARADVMPRPFVDTLSQFHDDVPARPLAELQPWIEAQLGTSLQSLFAHVEPQALGAASIAQVHRARLHDGSDVVIKVQYPEARWVIPTDLRMVRRVAGLVQHLQSTIDLRSLSGEITRFIELELDFRREAESTRRSADMLSERRDVRVPRIYEQFSRERVIVMEYLDGIQVTRTDDLRAAGHSLTKIAHRVGDIYGAMLFEYGFFHGDPHPGNLLVLADGKIGLLDFGLCKELPADFANRVARMMVSALIGDGEEALAAAGELGFETKHLRPEHLRSLLLSVLGDSDGRTELVRTLGEARVPTIPSDFALVLRTMLLLNGLSFRLAPGRRLIQGEIMQHLAAGARRDQLALAA